jgi:A/G-specific adenine glycosylase
MNEAVLEPKDFRRRLLHWYRTHKRDLPWREKTKDPYRIWISEIMLQQTTVRAVVPRYERWLKRFPDVESLSRASLQQVLTEWQGLGYYQRARNLHRAARIIAEDYGGILPDDYDRLRALPGFGPYTTAAVLSIAYDKPYAVLDANVRRVTMRLLALPGEARSGWDGDIRALLGSLLPSRNPGTFNQAMMELGALVCRSSRPDCLVCPVSDDCRAFAHGEQEVIPRPKKQNTIRLEAVVGLILDKRGRYLIQKRPDSGLLAGLWEFPGGKIEAGESREEALRRELREELGAEVTDLRHVTSVEHAYTQFRVKLHAFACSPRGTLELDRLRHRWVTLKGMRRFPVPSGSARIIRFLEQKKGTVPF